jgi:hypothetical protein
MSLREKLPSQHAESGHARTPDKPDKDQNRPTGLQLRKWNGEQWMLSWAYFIAAHYLPAVLRDEADGDSPSAKPGQANGGGEIRIRYVHYEVTICCRNPEEIMTRLNEMSIGVLEEIPERLSRATEVRDGAIVSRLDIVPRKEG